MSNDEMAMTKRNRFRLPLCIILGLVAGVLVVSAFAPAALADSWQAGNPIVPQCNTTWDQANARFTNQCTLCDLLHLVEHIVNFIIKTIFVVAGLLVMVAGFIILTAEGSGRQKIGREMLTKVVIGIVIMLISYVAVMTFLWILLPNPTDPATRAQFRIGIGGFEIECNPTVRVGGGPTTTTGREEPRPPRPGALPDTPTVDVNKWCPGTVEERKQRICRRVSDGTPGVSVEQCLVELRATLSQPKLLLSILEKETGGFPNKENNVYNITEGRQILSCGVAQISVATARDLGPRMGFADIPRPQSGQEATAADDRATCEWLKTRPLQSIRMADRLLRDRGVEAITTSRTNRYSLSDIEVTAAAYNGGPRANDPSRNCTTTQTPDTCPPLVSAAVPRWACPFDKPAGGSCQANVRYAVTRDYVAVVYACYTKP